MQRLGAILFDVLGPVQFSRQLRAARARLHRWLGRVYPRITWLCWVPNVAVAEWLVRRPGATSGLRAAGAV